MPVFPEGSPRPDIFNHLRNVPSLHSEGTTGHSQQQCMRVSVSLHPNNICWLQHSDCEVTFIDALAFLMTDDAEHLFYLFNGCLYIFLGEKSL